DKLGASISVSAGRESFDIRGSTLARNYRATMDLVEEILLEPRWDAERFALAKQRVLNELRQRSANPAALAQDVFARLLYGDHIMGRNPRGSEESVQAITLDDLKRYTAEALAPGEAAFHVARGALYFAGVPDARRGVGALVYLALAATEPGSDAAAVMNFRRCGGGFACDLTQVVREQPDYTYGIRSGFSGSTFPGPFSIAS